MQKGFQFLNVIKTINTIFLMHFSILYMSFFTKLNNIFLAGEYYISKHQCWTYQLLRRNKGEHIKDVYENNFNWLAVSKPTYWSSDNNKTPDVIDICFIKKKI